MDRTLHLLAEQAFSRAAGAPLVGGNFVRLLYDASENYPAWLDATHRARSWIHFESYIIYDDETGKEFADALVDCAHAGVRVSVLFDWVGALGATSRAYVTRLRRAGIEVRAFNRPRLDRPLAWLSRDHRKALTVDGNVAFVSGLCVGYAWVGNPERHEDPWRDTGIEMRGPCSRGRRAGVCRRLGGRGRAPAGGRSARPTRDCRRRRRRRALSPGSVGVRARMRAPVVCGAVILTALAPGRVVLATRRASE